MPFGRFEKESEERNFTIGRRVFRIYGLLLELRVWTNPDMARIREILVLVSRSLWSHIWRTPIFHAFSTRL